MPQPKSPPLLGWYLGNNNHNHKSLKHQINPWFPEIKNKKKQKSETLPFTQSNKRPLAILKTLCSLHKHHITQCGHSLPNLKIPMPPKVTCQRSSMTRIDRGMTQLNPNNSKHYKKRQNIIKTNKNPNPLSQIGVSRVCLEIELDLN